MSRRRNMICTSSSEDEDDQRRRPDHNTPPNPAPEQQDDVEQEEEIEDIETLGHDPIPNLDSVTLDSTSASASAAAHVVLSDEDFLDVSDNLSPPSPLPERPTPPTGVADAFAASDCPVNDCLKKMGLYLRREWLDSCKLGLQNSVAGFSGFDDESKAKLCFAQALFSDFNHSGVGVLPPNVHSMHLVDLDGPFVLQVDEVINISCPLKERYKGAKPGLKRCLKLSMTDGVQRVFAMEYRPIPNKTLEALAPAGFKVVIRNVNVRHGLLMLVPEVLEVLGGSVEELEAARGRLVHELNKPPRGKRSRTGVVPPLSVRATLAAWPQNSVNDNTVPVNGAHHVQGNSTNSTFHATPPFNGNIQGADRSSRNIQARPNIREATEVSGTRQTNQHSTSGESAQYSVVREAAQRSTAMKTDQLPTNREATEVSGTGQTDPRCTSGESAQCSVVREAAQRSTAMETDELPTNREATEPSSRRKSTGLSSLCMDVVENRDAHMVDLVDHPFILSGANELPFTYLASLSAKWAAVQGTEPSVQGKIKCFMAGVKGFQYQQRSTFELQVYVDDGSLISEILIHHNVVQKWIGYSPEELTASLSAPDKNIVNRTRNTLKQFQIFLIHFEGTMLVEMNETSTVPVALEMSEGSPTSDAQLLLQRLKSVSSRQPRQNVQSNVIDLSP